MKCLLDTHAFIWLITDDDRLSAKARKTILDSRTFLYLSSASIWEMVVKAAIGKLKLPVHPEAFVQKQLAAAQIQELPVSFKHAFHLQHLPNHHKDPFDRMLVAQALAEKLTILTIDPLIAQYPAKTLW
ncbi:type II toxin-antitoxin system VapC family toxin [Geotalea toluenoxydans]|uniref:type II toxin-antitoxin system VapC family toxin n=1 Tax=Geotalea toluenoxydans TaxID=421624 RepID=UPI0006D1D1BB|nr:type II toxin-antitoxin system VapC family toxin [Geotalea toluenoxydans]